MATTEVLGTTKKILVKDGLLEAFVNIKDGKLSSIMIPKIGDDNSEFKIYDTIKLNNLISILNVCKKVIEDETRDQAR